MKYKKCKCSNLVVILALISIIASPKLEFQTKNINQTTYIQIMQTHQKQFQEIGLKKLIIKSKAPWTAYASIGNIIIINNQQYTKLTRYYQEYVIQHEIGHQKCFTQFDFTEKCATLKAYDVLQKQNI